MTNQIPDTTIKSKTMKVNKEIKPTSDGARSEIQEHSPLPWIASFGERLSDASECRMIDCEEGSIAEMMCPKDVEDANALFIITAVNSYDALREALLGMIDLWARSQNKTYDGTPRNIEHDSQVIAARAALSLVDHPITEEAQTMNCQRCNTRDAIKNETFCLPCRQELDQQRRDQRRATNER